MSTEKCGFFKMDRFFPGMPGRRPRGGAMRNAERPDNGFQKRVIASRAAPGAPRAWRRVIDISGKDPAFTKSVMERLIDISAHPTNLKKSEKFAELPGGRLKKARSLILLRCEKKLTHSISNRIQAKIRRPAKSAKEPRNHGSIHKIEGAHPLCLSDFVSINAGIKRWSKRWCKTGLKTYALIQGDSHHRGRRPPPNAMPGNRCL